MTTPYTTLISVQALSQNVGSPNWAIVDCRFDLGDTERGRRDYLAAHIPGAVYAHLDDDLSGPDKATDEGWHPLPPIETFVQTLSDWGIDSNTQVVVYDDQTGVFAGRLWWMLRWLGHDTVALLEGGWHDWAQAGLPTRSDNETRAPRTFVPHPRHEMVLTTAEVERHAPDLRLVDARTADRYRGENEPIYPRAGHIPGAVSGFFGENLDAAGHFRPPEDLRAYYEQLLDGAAPEQTVMYCGSGVSAAHNVLAMEHAGLPGARLYVGSWSGWINDPQRPGETG